MAFGTGQHATTRACLELLAGLAADAPGASALDAGCGSGVLAIAARRLGLDPVWALDADPLAVEATLANARRNGVGLRVARRAIGADRLPAADLVAGEPHRRPAARPGGRAARAGPAGAGGLRDAPRGGAGGGGARCGRGGSGPCAGSTPTAGATLLLAR